MSAAAAIGHHPIFAKFRRWEGYAEPGFTFNFLGVKSRPEYVAQPGSAPVAGVLRPALPAFNEEYFEWIDLLEAVHCARGEFVMIELGAGYGRWIANAAAAAKACGAIPVRLIAVEAEPTHFLWLREHLETNGVDAARCSLHEAAVAASDGDLLFHVGNPAQCYGQRIAPQGWFHRLLRWAGRGPLRRRTELKMVRAVSLASILAPLAKVDLVDLDVQGAELEVLESAAPQLGKVQRIHIGTHGPRIEHGLRALFGRLGWHKLNDYGCGREYATPYGPIRFEDGVQTWLNPASR